MSYGLNVEMHKQTEICKRLDAIIRQVLPFLSAEVYLKLIKNNESGERSYIYGIDALYIYIYISFQIFSNF